MRKAKKPYIPPIRGALARFRLECAREIEYLDKCLSGSISHSIAATGTEEEKPADG